MPSPTIYAATTLALDILKPSDVHYPEYELDITKLRYETYDSWFDNLSTSKEGTFYIHTGFKKGESLDLKKKTMF